jgi:predicted nucleotidyltransferase
MFHQASHYQSPSHVNLKKLPVSPIDEAFFARLVAELDSDALTAIVLKGSYARGDASYYSDIDLTCFVKELPEQSQKRFAYKEGHLISISTRTLDEERERLAKPEQAVFVVQGLREARILLDKDGAFGLLQQEAKTFTWEHLQSAANKYAGQILMLHTEYVHKILRGLLLHDDIALAEIALELLFALTDAVVVQRGVLIMSGNTYFRQAQDAVGVDSMWTHHHKLVAGIEVHSMEDVSWEAKGVAVLRLYQETVKLLRPVLCPEHSSVIEETVSIIDQVLSDEQVS